MKYPKTPTQFLLEHLKDHPYKSDLILILDDLETIGKMISAKTNRAGLTDLLGSVGKVNIQNEVQQKLDVYTNDLCKEYLAQTGHYAAMASEEEEGIVPLRSAQGSASYIIAFDPLDGSSNIDVNVSIGTIFSVHRVIDSIDRDAVEQFLQVGHDQIIAGYLVYGTATQFVFSVGNGVYEFTLDKDIGEFFLTNEQMTIPNQVPYYSHNEAYTPIMPKHEQKFLAWVKESFNPKQRYIGSLIADFHRNLITGGLYLYPSIDKDSTGEFISKLRVNFEAKAMAFIAEQAGGAAIDGIQSILDIKPTELHQKTTLIIGNKDVVEHRLTIS